MDYAALDSYQQAAFDGVLDWAQHRDAQTFYVAGYAGTGKTTIAKVITDMIGREHIAFMAFSGKAASVMRAKGCANANTIHSWIYSPVEHLHECIHCGFFFGHETIEDHALGCPHNLRRDPGAAVIAPEKHDAVFTLKDRLGEHWVQDDLTEKWSKEAPDIRLIVLDECSMVSAELGADLESFGIPILVFGDPGQLPPPKGAGYFTDRTPDVFLEQIHRQALDSPIISMATMLRQNKTLRRGTMGNCVVTSRLKYDIFANPEAQILVGRNATRRSLNQQIRHRLGFRDTLPMVGEKLICLKNRPAAGMFNGTLWIVKEISWKETATAWGKFMLAEAVLVSEDTAALQVTVPLQGNSFTHPDGLDSIPPRAQEGWPFDFGYVLTVHKAQGSQWPHVIVLDEGFCWSREGNDFRWRYTAMTRAAESAVWLYV
jgi:exodeoxyribonuclease-5